jgi:UDP-N-acetylglucosamine:LPS N-acetylglucosamine transferase
VPIAKLVKIETPEQAMSVMRNQMGRRRRVLAVSSGGGHWIQLLRVSPAFASCDVAFVTVHESYRSQVTGHRFYSINDATRWNKFGLIQMALRLAGILWKERPDIVISTGAAPGYIALRLARLMGARTIWLDSLANIERISMSAEKISRHADLWLTQWSHLAKPEGPHYAGSVL